MTRIRRNAAGLPRRLRLALLTAVAVIIVDHAAKLGAAWLEPADYTHNPTPMDYDLLLLVPAVALLFPSRIAAFLYGAWIGGGSSNVIDVYLWPGGVPDFIPMGDWVWNPADFAIYGAGIALVFSPVWALFRVARRTYPERELAELPLESPSPDAL